jgi:hypothetical protein
MDTFSLIVVGVVLGAFVIYYIFRVVTAPPDRKPWGGRAAPPRHRLAEIEDERLIRAEGRLSYASDPLIAPLTGRKCACWEVTVEEYFITHEYSRSRRGYWQVILREQETSAFYLTDESGWAFVSPRYPDMTLTKSASAKIGGFIDATIEQEAFLKSRGQRSKDNEGFSRKLRFSEGVLDEGCTLAVAGQARREHDPAAGQAAGYRQSPIRLVIEAPDDGPLVMSDDLSSVGGVEG